MRKEKRYHFNYQVFLKNNEKFENTITQTDNEKLK